MDLSDKLRQLYDKDALLDDKVTANEDTLNDLEDKLKELKDQIRNNEVAKVTQGAQDLQGVNDALIALNNLINTKADDDVLKALVVRLDNKDNKQEEDIKAIMDHIKDTEQKKQEDEQRAAKNKALVQSLNDRFDDIDNKIKAGDDKNMNDIEDLKNLLKAIQDQINNNDNKDNKQDEEIENIKQQVNELKNRDDAQYDRDSKLDDAVKQLADRVQDLADKFNDTQEAKLSEAPQDLDRINEKLNAILVILKSKVDKETIIQIEQRIIQLETLYREQNTQIIVMNNTFTEQIQVIISRLEVLEHRVIEHRETEYIVLQQNVQLLMQKVDELADKNKELQLKLEEKELNEEEEDVVAVTRDVQIAEEEEAPESAIVEASKSDDENEEEDEEEELLIEHESFDLRRLILRVDALTFAFIILAISYLIILARS
ncbi:hypothetical protein TVAG_203900 [Trichomonas vaginalis G3]|uniref:Uncharacterized protein n=1 Tax=Trichomonas vaginalis (strain ATCC PRA-98 / G3) TaxID=412133 RepID=A2ETG6_TRIV3|nr:microtubule binding [Trichomonas vaginalis G3]EAY04086.1 hypothetical protein TVAG_203900 [Trichomonas vaginalis G3]KAI5513405.1 microtubule binding [Trichomonas vaginalis G3]|eukprot:XP_001316309.1 hypothetical protein [Trichomonas vaginalis G3]